MALKVDFELDGIIYRDCYLRIHKVKSTMVDYEYFENVNDPDRPDIAQELKWKVRMESSATAYVWESVDGRENRAQPMKWFSFDFEYDLDNDRNIYQQAYDALKSHEKFSDGLDV
jgi:hypothetical protein